MCKQLSCPTQFRLTYHTKIVKQLSLRLILQEEFLKKLEVEVQKPSGKHLNKYLLDPSNFE